MAGEIQRRKVKLITYDKHEVLHYQGDCKLTINSLSKVLNIRPKDTDFMDISALFRWKFIQRKNLLFVIADLNTQDFVLVFANENICKKVLDKIYSKREIDTIAQQQLQQRLLIPIFQLISKNVYSTKFKKIILKWIEMHENEEKKELWQLLKQQKNNQILDAKNVKQEINSKNARKRRISEIDKCERSREINISTDEEKRNLYKKKVISSKTQRNAKIIQESLFEIVNFKNQRCYRRKLLIFTSPERTHCFEYNSFPTKQLFYHRCQNGGRGYKAVLRLNNDGKEIIKLENKEHRCYPIPYIPEKYVELKIVKKPGYEFMDNCSTNSKKALIVFDPNYKSQCYEYYWSSADQKFHCSGCLLERKRVSAIICHEGKEQEYIMLLSGQHLCKIREYNPERFNQINQFVLSPNFEIQRKLKDGIERKALIIFKQNDRSLCHVFYYNVRKTKFICNDCRSFSAKLCQNSDGEEYVILSNAEHICEMRTYIPHNEIILRPPKIKYVETNEIKNSRLFIFDPSNPKMCYLFGKNHGRYNCLGCRRVAAINIDDKELNGNFSVAVCRDESANEYYVRMKDDQKHICKPKLYEPEKYEPKILMPKTDFVLFRGKCSRNSVLAIFHSEKKSLCYKYHYDKSKKLFRCNECIKKKEGIHARIHQNADGSEYVIINQKMHVCKPFKYSAIINSDTVILEKSGLSFEETKPKNNEMDGIDESRILRSPYFELRKNNRNIPDRRLFVFKENDNTMCYEYAYLSRCFHCKKCDATAKIHIDTETDEKCIILGKVEHSCEPIKYDAGNPVIYSSNYMLFNQDDENKPTKLVTFTSSTKDLCYEYTWSQDKKYFRCQACRNLKNIVWSKLKKDNNEKECVEFSKNEHVCQPKKYVLEEFQPKVIRESGFKLFNNKNDKPNSKLILFDPEKDGFGFEYYMASKNLFLCIPCKHKKTNVTAKLCEKENGEKYLELSHIEHVCKSLIY